MYGGDIFPANLIWAPNKRFVEAVARQWFIVVIISKLDSQCPDFSLALPVLNSFPDTVGSDLTSASFLRTAELHQRQLPFTFR